MTSLDIIEPRAKNGIAGNTPLLHAFVALQHVSISIPLMLLVANATAT